MSTTSIAGTDRMTAAVLYGSEELRIEQIGVPEIAADEVLVRVKVALTDGTDLKVWRRGYHAAMINPPAVFGHELAGEVAAVGSEVRGFRVGDRVVPANSAPCLECFFCKRGQPNLCEDLLFNNGAYAEYIRVPGRIVRENTLQIPEGVSFRDAALTEPLACVIRGIHETGIQPGDAVVVIGCGPIGLKFIRVLSGRGVNIIALAKRESQIKIARNLGASLALNVTTLTDPITAVRDLTPLHRGADFVIEAAGVPEACEWAPKMVRRGGTVNLFAGCRADARVKFEPAELHYSEITIKSSFHHTPEFFREALATIARGEIRAADFITAEARLTDLPRVFQQMKQGNGGIKTAVIP
ncbi:MAG TPA: alcohol dehydrogenase catalytic domain-containing protein [Candidatus Acidoferrales bacterium]|nr:alcohol dehydrogenase catalytic domain-containing protein [Candidatus Acidoferrales bacterium]